MQFREFYFHGGTQTLMMTTGTKFDYSDSADTPVTDLLLHPYLIYNSVTHDAVIDLQFYPTGVDALTSFLSPSTGNILKLLDGTFISFDSASGFLSYNGLVSCSFVVDGFTISSGTYGTLYVSKSLPSNSNVLIPAPDLTTVSNMITSLSSGFSTLNTGFTALSTSVDTKINALPADVANLITNSNFAQMDYFDLNGNYGSYPNLSNVLLLPHNHAYTVESSYLFQNDTDQFLVMYILTDALGKKMVAPHNFLQLVV